MPQEGGEHSEAMAAPQHWDVQSNSKASIARILPIQHARQSGSLLAVVCACTCGSPSDEQIAAAAAGAAIENFELLRRNNSTTRALNDTVRRVLDLARRRRLIPGQPAIDAHLHIVLAATEEDHLCIARANTGATILLRGGAITRLEMGAPGDAHSIVVRQFQLKAGDRILFATQSLLNRLHERQLGNILKKHPSARNAAYALLTAAEAQESVEMIAAGVIDFSDMPAQTATHSAEGSLQSIGAQSRLRPIPALLSLAFLLVYGGLMLGLIAGVRLPRIVSEVSEAKTESLSPPASAAVLMTPTALPTADFAALGWLTETAQRDTQIALQPLQPSPTVAPTETPLRPATQAAPITPTTAQPPTPSPQPTQPPTPTASPLPSATFEPTWTAEPTREPTRIIPTRVRPTRTPVPPAPTETPLPAPTETPLPPQPQPQPQPQPPPQETALPEPTALPTPPDPCLPGAVCP